MVSTFFENQTRAKRKTAILLFYFFSAILAIIFAIYFAALFLFQTGSGAEEMTLWQPDFFAAVSLSTLLIVAAGSLYKLLVLRQGGARVAQSLGGRILYPETDDQKERQLLNVVEEISIASGTPVPGIYILDQEKGINAFAAGRTTHDAVIGVTRGCLEKLSRDELQGVIAHEFSHILNGDMRLNIRLMGILHGILLIALIGYIMLRSSTRASYRHYSNKRSSGGGFAAIGLALYIIGYIGVFFGNLIKAAISRQREFLADASAVQFTRNASGISDALKKIGGLKRGSQLRSSHAEEASHMFFSEGISRWFGGLFSTHPPLLKRIRAIDPAFQVDHFDLIPEDFVAPIDNGASSFTAQSVQRSHSKDDASIESQALIDSCGQPEEKHFHYAEKVLASIPLALQQYCRNPYSARLIIFALLLDQREDLRSAQEKLLRGELPEIEFLEMRKVTRSLEKIERRFYIPLVDLCIPALKQLSLAQYQHFETLLKKMVSVDNAVSLFEYTLHHCLLRHVGLQFQEKKSKFVKYPPIEVKRAALALLLNLSLAGNSHQDSRKKAYEQAVKTYAAGSAKEFDASGEADLSVIDNSLTVLAAAEPIHKDFLLRACLACIENDGKVSLEEAELLRAIADALDCPIPPCLPDRK